MSINPYESYKPHPRHIACPNYYDHNGAIIIERIDPKKIEKITCPSNEVAAAVVGGGALCAMVVLVADFFRQAMGYK